MSGPDDGSSEGSRSGLGSGKAGRSYDGAGEGNTVTQVTVTAPASVTAPGSVTTVATVQTRPCGAPLIALVRAHGGDDGKTDQLEIE